MESMTKWQEQFDKLFPITQPKLVDGAEVRFFMEYNGALKNFIQSLLDQRDKECEDALKQMNEAWNVLVKEQKSELLQNIGALRQWLNEDRITDPERMVTNEQIARWLKLDEPPIEGKDETPSEEEN